MLNFDLILKCIYSFPPLEPRCSIATRMKTLTTLHIYFKISARAKNVSSSCDLQNQ